MAESALVSAKDRSLTPVKAQQLAAAELDVWKKQPRNTGYICEEVHYNTLAREWRCKWSEEDQKRSLTECQRVLEEVVVPALRKVHGLLSVQRVVCGESKDFKVICKMSLDAFEDWATLSFFPEEKVVEAFYAIDGISKIECQTYTLEPVFGPGK
mmetsp:Transcript_30447/g.48808  ORF Transcript_30447/g.48808 Transcript_30447/m.48808 type:complete len:155 (+) Transcript_30447:68-532(+)